MDHYVWHMLLAKQNIRHWYSFVFILFLSISQPLVHGDRLHAPFSLLSSSKSQEKESVIWQINSTYFDFLKVGHWADYIQQVFFKGRILHGTFILSIKCAILFLSLLPSQISVTPVDELSKTLKVITGILPLQSSKFIFH